MRPSLPGAVARRLNTVLATTLLCSACTIDAVTPIGSSDPPAQAVSAVSINSHPSAVTLGRTITLSAVARRADNTIIPGAAIQWSISNTEIATISSTEENSVVISGIRAGNVQVTAASGGRSVKSGLLVTLVGSSGP